MRNFDRCIDRLRIARDTLSNAGRGACRTWLIMFKVGGYVIIPARSPREAVAFYCAIGPRTGPSARSWTSLQGNIVHVSEISDQDTWILDEERILSA